MNIDYDNLFNLGLEEFSAEMLKIQSKIKPLVIEYKVLKSIDHLSFDAVKKYIKPDPNNNRIRYIFYDEREDEIYSNEKKRRPFGGKYDYINCEPYYLPFGVVEVAIRGFSISRKESDYKHPHMERAFEERNFFYYDFDEEHYVQINLEKTKNPNTIEFLKRKEQGILVERKMKKYGKLYYRAYDDILERVKGVVGSKKKEIISFLEDVKGFLSVEFPKGLLARLILSEVNSEEYKILSDEVKQYVSNIDDQLTDLSSLIVEDDFDFSDLVELDPMKEFLKNAENFRVGILNVLFTPRPEKKPRFLKINRNGVTVEMAVGYLYEPSEDILCPNISELERRSSYYDKSANPLSEQEIMKEIRFKLQQKEKNMVVADTVEIEENEQNYPAELTKYFTAEQLKNLLKLSTAKRMEEDLIKLFGQHKNKGPKVPPSLRPEEKVGGKKGYLQLARELSNLLFDFKRRET